MNAAHLVGALLRLLPEYPVRRGKCGGKNPAGAAHKDVRRFRRRRMRLTEIPAAFANPAASSLGAALGCVFFGYFLCTSKESDSREARNALSSKKG